MSETLTILFHKNGQEKNWCFYHETIAIFAKRIDLW